MVAAFQDTEPTTLEEYLSTPVESSHDAESLDESLSADDQIQGEQSSEDTELVAPDSDTEQPTEESETTEELGEGSPSAEPAVAQFNWDSDENPYLKDAQVLQAIRQLHEQQQREAEEKARIEQYEAVMKRLASGEIDDDDIPIITGDFVRQVSEHAARPYVEQAQTYENGLAALVAAVKQESPEVQARLETRAKEFRETGRSAQEIETAFNASMRFRQQADAENADLKKQIKNLTAQLAAKAIQDSGVNRTESAAVGGGGEREYASLEDYLSDESIGRRI